MCNYRKQEPQPKTIKYPAIQYESECGFLLVLFTQDTKLIDFKMCDIPVLPSGKCMKCNGDIKNL